MRFDKTEGEIIMVLLITALSVKRKLHGKDQIAIPKDKHDSSSVQAWLWRNDELSKYQQESQLPLTNVSIPTPPQAKMSKMCR